MQLKLIKELLRYGSPMSAMGFEKLLKELHEAMNPSGNIETLLYNPKEAIKFTDAVREKAGKNLPDEMILRRLQNLRKSGSLKE